jgi:hypothetical protein
VTCDFSQLPTVFLTALNDRSSDGDGRCSLKGRSLNLHRSDGVVYGTVAEGSDVFMLKNADAGRRRLPSFEG